MVGKRFVCGVAAAAFVAIAWTATALAAGGASLSGYNRPAEIQSNVEGANAGVLGANTVGSLPFTGVDLGIIAAVGLILVALGWKLRRTGRRSA
jgi:hypothetical protein